MTDDEQDAADAARMLRAHQQLHGALTEFEAAQREDGGSTGVTAMTDKIVMTFDNINWETLDINAVYAFYETCGRPVEQRALLCAPINPALREDWRRRCVADFKAMQGRDCPSCGN